MNIKIHKEKKDSDLINMYYKEKKKKNENYYLDEKKNKLIKEIFKTNSEYYEPPSTINGNDSAFITLESNNNKKSESEYIIVIESIKIMFKEFMNYNQIKKMEIDRIPPQNKIIDLINSYYKRKVIQNNDQYKFIYNEYNINTKENKNITLTKLFKMI